MGAYRVVGLTCLLVCLATTLTGQGPQQIGGVELTVISLHSQETWQDEKAPMSPRVVAPSGGAVIVAVIGLKATTSRSSEQVQVNGPFTLVDESGAKYSSDLIGMNWAWIDPATWAWEWQLPFVLKAPTKLSKIVIEGKEFDIANMAVAASPAKTEPTRRLSGNNPAR